MIELQFNKKIDPSQLRSEMHAAGIPWRKGMLKPTDNWGALKVFALDEAEVTPITQVVTDHQPLRKRVVTPATDKNATQLHDELLAAFPLNNGERIEVEGDATSITITVPFRLTNSAVATIINSHVAIAKPPPADLDALFGAVRAATTFETFKDALILYEEGKHPARKV